MTWWKLLTPSLVLDNSVCAVTPALLARYALRGLIVDVDDTIVCSSGLDIPQEVFKWAESLKQNYPIWLVSNNFNQQRIQQIADKLGLPCRSRAGKPSLRAINYALATMQLPPHQVAMVGDRLLTDVVAGNRAGMFSILVQPIASDQQVSFFSALKLRTSWVRQSEIWLARKSGVKI
jgi:HAD superfamily phosphatase (TIGR01668 family)